METNLSVLMHVGYEYKYKINCRQMNVIMAQWWNNTEQVQQKYSQKVLSSVPNANQQNSRLDNKFINLYEGWNFNSGNYLFTTDTK